MCSILLSFIEVSQLAKLVLSRFLRNYRMRSFSSSGIDKLREGTQHDR